MSQYPSGMLFSSLSDYVWFHFEAAYPARFCGRLPIYLVFTRSNVYKMVASLAIGNAFIFCRHFWLIETSRKRDFGFDKHYYCYLTIRKGLTFSQYSAFNIGI